MIILITRGFCDAGRAFFCHSLVFLRRRANVEMAPAHRSRTAPTHIPRLLTRLIHTTAHYVIFISLRRERAATQVLPCLIWLISRAFALGARTHTADRAISERTVRMVCVLSFQNRACELLSPRWRREISRSVRALPVRVFLFRCGIPRAVVRCDGEGNKSPSI